MNVRIFWVRAMKCMCAQTRPRFILSSEGVFGGMEFEPMLTPREKSPLPENVPRGRSNPRHCGQRAQALPTELFWPPNSSMTRTADPLCTGTDPSPNPPPQSYFDNRHEQALTTRMSHHKKPTARSTTFAEKVSFCHDHLTGCLSEGKCNKGERKRRNQTRTKKKNNRIKRKRKESGVTLLVPDKNLRRQWCLFKTR